MKNFELITFDIDGTLTSSKQPITSDMAELLCRLLGKFKVAIISGASFRQFEWQILSKLDCDSGLLKKLTLLPVDGTTTCSYQDSWQCQAGAELLPEEKQAIRAAFENIFEKSGVEMPANIYGEIVEDRGAQMNFSALGQDAPPEPKLAWDPDNKKREKMAEVLKQALPGYSIRIGGTTSIEVTKHGIDKGYGLEKLLTHTGISKDKVLYIGDKLFKGGNDEPALSMGLECRAVNGPEETKALILELLKG